MTHAIQIAGFWVALLMSLAPLGSLQSNLAKAATDEQSFELAKNKISSFPSGMDDTVLIRTAGSADNNTESRIIVNPTLEPILDEK